LHSKTIPTIKILALSFEVPRSEMRNYHLLLVIARVKLNKTRKPYSNIY